VLHPPRSRGAGRAKLARLNEGRNVPSFIQYKLPRRGPGDRGIGTGEQAFEWVVLCVVRLRVRAVWVGTWVCWVVSLGRLGCAKVASSCCM